MLIRNAEPPITSASDSTKRPIHLCSRGTRARIVGTNCSGASSMNSSPARMKSEALLAGRIFDDRGNRMSPSHARKRGIKYRYYLSTALIQGRAERAGSIRRVPAADIEALVIKSVREHLKPSVSIDDRSLINTHVVRVEIQADQLIIRFS